MSGLRRELGLEPVCPPVHRLVIGAGVSGNGGDDEILGDLASAGRRLPVRSIRDHARHMLAGFQGSPDIGGP